MTRKFLWWCICWFVSSSLSIASCPAQALPRPIPAEKMDAPQEENNGQRTTDHGLPCLDSSPVCLQTLSDLAVQNSREIAVLDQAITLQKKKLWTSWLNADGWHPFAIGLRIARNLAGGGDRAALKLDIARLELRQAELAAQLRNLSVQAVLAYETSQRQLNVKETKLAAHQVRLRLLTTEYRLGEGNTEAMLQWWQTERELQQEAIEAKAVCQQRLTQLQWLIVPWTIRARPAPNKKD